MSHFSKIKTNISDLEILKKTLKELGFTYRISNILFGNEDDQITNILNNILVFNTIDTQNPVFYFTYNCNEYHLVADLSLWSLDINIDYFLEKLMQRYALNIVKKESLSIGFDHQQCLEMIDGSLKLTVTKWNS